jgi:undecaprenyl phosphate N,N'-diacetylbacillosamine 1-phosphate transferase
MSLIQAAVKRAIDVVVSFVALAVLSPLLLLIALAVRLTSPGPALFRQRRLGKDGVPFTLYKFRSMFVNSPDIRNPDGSTFNAKDDPRVTPLGRFLRKTSLDELPQLINVLKGDMSLVGPRPDQVDQYQYYSAEEKRKLLVKPGITGLAAVKVRNTATWAQRKQLDIEYVERQSLWLDLVILVRTIGVVLQQKGIFVTSADDNVVKVR